MPFRARRVYDAAFISSLIYFVERCYLPFRLIICSSSTPTPADARYARRDILRGATF